MRRCASAARAACRAATTRSCSTSVAGPVSRRSATQRSSAQAKSSASIARRRRRSSQPKHSARNDPACARAPSPPPKANSSTCCSQATSSPNSTNEARRSCATRSRDRALRSSSSRATSPLHVGCRRCATSSPRRCTSWRRARTAARAPRSQSLASGATSSEPPQEAFTSGEWARAGRDVGIDLRALPYAFVCLSRDPVAAPAPRHRILGRPDVGKHEARAQVCDADGLAIATVTKRKDPATWRLLKKDPHALRELPDAPPS